MTHECATILWSFYLTLTSNEPAMTTPTPVNELIKGMNYPELRTLAGIIADEMHRLRATGLEQLHKELEQKAADLGVSLAELDHHEDLIGGSYVLEVTSPGVDRPLTGPRHWRRARRRLVQVRRHDGTTFAGRVGRAGDASVELLVDGVLKDLPYADVAHAAVQVEFRPPPDDELRMLNSEETA